MKANQLPQVVLAKLLEMDASVAELTSGAAKAEARVAYARHVLNGGDNSVTAEEYERERSSFDENYARAMAAKVQAETERKVLAEAKAWVESLPSDSKLLLVQPAASDLDLAALCARLAGLREELKRLNGTPPVASDIEAKVAAYVASLAARASPLVRGFAEGLALDVKWPMGLDANRTNGVGFSNSDANCLVLLAAITPRELSKLIMQAIERAQPLSQAEHAARRREIEHAIDELSYSVAALSEQADPLMAPWHVLGVRTVEEETAPAAA
jgi:hypothetical protein